MHPGMVDKNDLRDRSLDRLSSRLPSASRQAAPADSIYPAPFDRFSNRDWFYCLLHEEGHPSVLEAARLCVISSFYNGHQEARNQTLVYPAQLLHDCEALRDRMQGLQRTLQDLACTRPVRVWTLQQLAPYALTAACHLQGLTTDLIADNTLAFRLYAEFAGEFCAPSGQVNSRERFRLCLTQEDADFPREDSVRFAHNAVISEAVFALPVWLLSLSLCAREFLPEVLGVHLGYKLAGVTINWLVEQGSEPSDLSSTHSAKTDVLSSVHALIKNIFPQLATGELGRIHTGISAFGTAYLDMLTSIASARPQPSAALTAQVLELFRTKLKGTHGFHQGVMLQEKPLEDWLKDGLVDGMSFLNALAKSAYIDCDVPTQSKLLQLMHFGGPMFGVFSGAEQSLIIRWIEGLRESCNTSIKSDISKDTSQCLDLRLPPTLCRASESKPYAKASRRELFHYLIGIDKHAACLPTAHHTLRRSVATARRRLNFPWSLPRLWRQFAYSPQALSQRIDAIYAQQADPHSRYPQPPLLSQVQCRWLIQQIAPTALVDGCWLQGVPRSGLRPMTVVNHLTQIYHDELGGGFPAQNHARLYRELLRSMNIELPPVDTQAFVDNETLLATAFDLPVLFMCISMFSKELFPELLGLNLAIELSGLGNEYRAIIEELRYWKYDPYFFVLHQSIDNRASGHTATAEEAIRLYLEEIAQLAGSQAQQMQWSRIWCGYLMFNLTLQRFLRSLLLHLAPGAVAQWLTRLIVSRDNSKHLSHIE